MRMNLERWLAFIPIVCVASACRESTASGGSVRERWYQGQPGYGYARPATSGDLVFFGTGDGQVIARRQATGAAVWTTKVASQWIGGSIMIVRDGVLVVPIVQSTVGIDVATGSQLWKYDAPVDTGAQTGPTPSPGQVFRTHLDSDPQTVFIPAWGASISAVDISTGAVRWIWEPGASATDTAAVRFRSGSEGARASGDTVFATAWHFLDRTGNSSEAWLVALDRQTGRELWRFVVPTRYTGGAFVNGAPVVWGNLVIFESIGGHEYAVDRSTQRLVWEHKPNTTNATEAESELFGDIVYHDGGDGYIDALRASDGSLVWRAAFGGMTTRDLLVTDRRVIFTDGGSLRVLDRATGREIVRLQQPRTSDSFFGSPAAYANGQIFVTVGGAAWSFDEP
ncbi:MAG: PQQ-binding-like beta-propeller repeat protein [Gemmatimonadaceae bacterium]|nr:PQQ-binding-like beta-propeller repeat protein [Gemmatimonadaceae bacterium]NUQ92276.1 PQQ-binding-like beta-propeller repeat protein [Gemmatimonadaceae bacterium]NUR20736.1 PQQ-binding-like beta-propeller repeat protein [Gemmatimonadaceae bacterium]